MNKITTIIGLSFIYWYINNNLPYDWYKIPDFKKIFTYWYSS